MEVGTGFKRVTQDEKDDDRHKPNGLMEFYLKLSPRRKKSPKS